MNEDYTHEFAFGVDRGARIHLGAENGSVRVTLTVRGLDGIDHVVSDLISPASAVGVAAGFSDMARQAEA